MTDLEDRIRIVLRHQSEAMDVPPPNPVTGSSRSADRPNRGVGGPCSSSPP